MKLSFLVYIALFVVAGSDGDPIVPLVKPAPPPLVAQISPLSGFDWAEPPAPVVLQRDTVRYWTMKWNLGLNGSQASFNNWSQGNNDAVAVTASNLFNGSYKRDKYAYDLMVNLRYGQTRINRSEVRKTDDLMHMKHRVDHLLHAKHTSAYFEVDFRSQFDKGYDRNWVLLSDFFAPAYLLETAGLGYKPVEFFHVQTGLSLKQTFVADTSLSRRYGLDQGATYRSEGGFSVGATLKKTVAKNLVLNSNVQTFTNFYESIDSTDVIFSNELTGKINSFMNTNIQFVLMYDKDFNDKIQLKQVIAVGLSFNVF